MEREGVLIRPRPSGVVDPEREMMRSMEDAGCRTAGRDILALPGRADCKSGDVGCVSAVSAHITSLLIELVQVRDGP
jgi:hypothetical protein